MHQRKVISEGVLKTAKKMVGFRVDLEEVYAIYKRHLNGFEKFAAEIEKFISA